MKILVVEDDAALADVIRRGLSESGHVVDIEGDGHDAERVAAEHPYDAIVLDVMLPGIEGFDVARTLRARDVRTPILMLTALDTAEDVVEGLDSGADDYLRKPFVFDELEARLHSITRRESAPQTDVLRVGDLTMDLATREVRRGDRVIELTRRETAFLEYLMRNAGLLLSRKVLENALWDSDRQTASNVIDVCVKRLRRKLSIGNEQRLITTVRGVGYQLSPHERG